MAAGHDGHRRIREGLRGILAAQLLWLALGKFVAGHDPRSFLSASVFWSACVAEGMLGVLLLTKLWVGCAWTLLMIVVMLIPIAWSLGAVECGCLAGVWNDTVAARLAVLGTLGAGTCALLMFSGGTRAPVARPVHGQQSAAPFR